MTDLQIVDLILLKLFNGPSSIEGTINIPEYQQERIKEILLNEGLAIEEESLQVNDQFSITARGHDIIEKHGSYSLFLIREHQMIISEAKSKHVATKLQTAAVIVSIVSILINVFLTYCVNSKAVENEKLKQGINKKQHTVDSFRSINALPKKK
jgi:predicted transcriptional regulator